ncbi:hypothetical protein [Ureibacillus terrenus]|uniref:hypothetical protein n=1 Tax=Ureibacillus terrenus TaxID=118246 RepID=UPI002E1F4FF6|nr:hypothetical protein [Ureibacillus terrenus]
MRKWYEYLTAEQKKEVITKLEESLKELEIELENYSDAFSPLVKEILLDTKDRWTFEMEMLKKESGISI